MPAGPGADSRTVRGARVSYNPWSEASADRRRLGLGPGRRGGRDAGAAADPARARHDGGGRGSGDRGLHGRAGARAAAGGGAARALVGPRRRSVVRRRVDRLRERGLAGAAARDAGSAGAGGRSAAGRGVRRARRRRHGPPDLDRRGGRGDRRRAGPGRPADRAVRLEGDLHRAGAGGAGGGAGAAARRSARSPGGRRSARSPRPPCRARPHPALRRAHRGRLPPRPASDQRLERRAARRGGRSQRAPGRSRRRLLPTRSRRHAGDAALPPTDKIALAPRLFAEIETEDPRDALARAVARERRLVGRGDRDLLSRLEELEGQLGGGTGGLLGELEQLEERYGGGLLDELNERLGGSASPEELRSELDALADELDEIVLAAVDAAFSPAFAITGGMALLAALVLMPGRRRGPPAEAGGAPGARPRGTLRAGAILAALAVALALPAAYAIARTELEPEPVEIADPCEDRERDSVGGVEGAAEDVALDALDRAACEFGSSREELVLALFDEESRRAYEREHGVDPRSLEELLRGIVGL